MTLYPGSTDYDGVLSRPDVFFSDQEIRRRVLACRPDGMPDRVAGRYAFTYRMVASADGTSPIAVRCFQYEVPDVVERYRAVDSLVARMRSPMFVGFRLTAPTADTPKAGVRVNGSWFPVVRMEWASGRTLDEYVLGHLLEPIRLQRLRGQLLEFEGLTRRYGFAHGDIHPQNMIVDDVGHLTMVDYDGMFMPELKRFGAGMAGQADYQSPVRMADTSLFDADLDRFPLIVLDLSLAALACRPELMRSVAKAPTDGLLLGAPDLANPLSSSMLDEIAALPGFAAPVALLRSACAARLEDVPRLDAFQKSYGKSTPKPKTPPPRWSVAGVGPSASTPRAASVPQGTQTSGASERPRSLRMAFLLALSTIALVAYIVWDHEDARSIPDPKQPHGVEPAPKVAGSRHVYRSLGGKRVTVQFASDSDEARAAAASVVRELAASTPKAFVKPIPTAMFPRTVIFYHSFDRTAAEVLTGLMERRFGGDWRTLDRSNERPLPSPGSLEVYLP